MPQLTRDQEIRQDLAQSFFRNILNTAGFVRPQLAAIEGSLLDERLDMVAQQIIRINQDSQGELLAQLSQAPCEASDIFYSNQWLATALMRAGFSPMAFEPTWQGACFKRLKPGASYEQCALEIYNRAFALGWNPDSALDLSEFGNPAQKAFDHLIEYGDHLTERGRQIFELCSLHCPRFTLNSARRASLAYEGEDEENKAEQALSFFSSLIDQRALQKAANPSVQRGVRSASL